MEKTLEEELADLYQKYEDLQIAAQLAGKMELTENKEATIRFYEHQKGVLEIGIQLLTLRMGVDSINSTKNLLAGLNVADNL